MPAFGSTWLLILSVGLLACGKRSEVEVAAVDGGNDGSTGSVERAKEAEDVEDEADESEEVGLRVVTAPDEITEVTPRIEPNLSADDDDERGSGIGVRSVLRLLVGGFSVAPHAHEPSAAESETEGEVEQGTEGDMAAALEEALAGIDRDKLATLGIDLSNATLVSRSSELHAAIAPGATIVLKSGTYNLGDHADDALGTTSDLTLVGVGEKPPSLYRSDPEQPVLTLEGVDGVTLYNLQLLRYRGRTTVKAPTVRVLRSKAVRLLRTDLRAESQRAIELYDVRGFEVRNAHVYGHHTGIATMVDATEVTFAKTNFWTDGRLNHGFALLRSKFEMLECSVRHHRSYGGRESILFQLDPPADLAKELAQSVPAPRRADSEVVLVKSRLTDNQFGRLASPPDSLTVVSSSFDELQFEDASRKGARGWWCECHRERASTHFVPTTVCHATPTRCEEAEKRIEGEPMIGVLASSSMRQCRGFYGRALADALGAPGRWVRGEADTERVVGECLPQPKRGAGPIALPPVDPERPATQAVEWATLAPIRRAQQSGSRVDVLIPTENPAIEARYPMLAHEGGPTLHRGHPTLAKLGPELESLPEPWFVTAKGVVRAEPFVSARLFGTLYDGNWWAVRYPRAGLRDPLIAVSGEPSASARLRAAPKERSVGTLEPAVRAATLALTGRDQLWLERESGVTQTVQALDGRFPGGATRVAAVLWWSPEMELSSGGLFTIDPKGELVQSIGGSPSVWGAIVELDYVGDIDGDGYDEIGWKSAGMEDIALHLTRLTETKVETRSLFASGH